MGLLYAIFSIFITLIFPKQITDVICYGRHRERVKKYIVLYMFFGHSFLVCFVL